MPDVDALDLALLTALRENPRAGALALSRLTHVARATVESRLSRLERAGVITGYGPDIDVAAAGFTVIAFVTLEIAQGALDRVKSDLSDIPAVLEAYAVTGSADMICKVAATSHADLQQTLLRIDSSPSVARSTSAIALSTVIAPRDLPLLTSRAPATTPRSPAFRLTQRAPAFRLGTRGRRSLETRRPSPRVRSFPDGVLDVLAGLLQVALDLVGLALDFKRRVVNGLTVSLLDLALGLLGLVLCLVSCTHGRSFLRWTFRPYLGPLPMRSAFTQAWGSSSRKPTLSVTWKWIRWSPSIRPRMSLTSNQSRLWSVFDARPMAPLIASSMLSAEEPTISLTE
jgi:DNA-binding Lrp family transcriptional regulator